MGRIHQWLATGGGEVMNAAAARLVKILNYRSILSDSRGRPPGVPDHGSHLATREFLALDHPTIGDIACFPYTAMAGEGISLAPYAHVRAWLGHAAHAGLHPHAGHPAL
jgi:glutathione S-transferase